MAKKIDGLYIADDTIDSQHYAAGSVDGEHLSTDAKQSTLQSALVAASVAVTTFSPSAASSDTVTAQVEGAATTDTPQTDLSAKGIYTGTISNAGDAKKVQIFDDGTDNGIDDGTGDDVYGVLSEAAGVYTLSYKKADGTAHTMAGTETITFKFVEIFDLDNLPTEAILVTGVAGVIDATSADVINTHLNGGSSKHDASEIDVEGSYTTITTSDVESALGDLDTAYSGHVDGGGSKHDANEIDVEGSYTTVTSSDVEGAISDLDTAYSGHVDGGANKHDADEIDYERADGSKKNIAAASDDVEAALTNLDDAVGALDATPSNYTPSDASIVADHLAGIDTALAAAGGTSFVDNTFEIKDDGDATKVLEFQCSSITTANTRTVTAADRDIDLDNVTEKFTEVITLNSTNITNKYVDLSTIGSVDVKDPAETAVLIPLDPGGPEQEYTVDFTIITDGSNILRVNWNGLGLDGVVADGHKIVVKGEIDG